MTDSPDEYGDILRRALRAEADAVVPSPDGLQIIRARIEERAAARRLLWWRAGASAVGAVLVAATLWVVIPQFTEGAPTKSSTVEQVENETSAPEIAATSRPPAPSAPPPSVPAKVVPVPSATEQHKKSPLPREQSQTPRNRPCPAASNSSRCPTNGSPVSTPTPTPSATPDSTPDPCPSHECPPADSDPSPSDLPTPDEPSLSGTPSG